MKNLLAIMQGLALISSYQAETIKALKQILKNTERQIAAEKKRKHRVKLS